MEQLQMNDHYRVVTVDLLAGTNMPRHIATSDAYLIVEDGSALLIYAGETYELNKGNNIMIPANREHILRVINDFKGYIILANNATISYFNIDAQQIN
jgi:quercetin dioxygenase-like cupin family protein